MLLAQEVRGFHFGPGTFLWSLHFLPFGFSSSPPSQNLSAVFTLRRVLAADSERQDLRRISSSSSSGRMKLNQVFYRNAKSPNSYQGDERELAHEHWSPPLSLTLR